MSPKSDSETKLQFDPKLIDELIVGRSTAHDLQGLIDQFTKTLLERALAGELTHHLGYEKNAKAKAGNARNGSSSKTLKTKQGEIDLDIPRDRNASFEPHIVAKHQTRWEGFDDLILSLYSRGLTVREIREHVQEIYGVEVAPDFISTVTDSVVEAVKASAQSAFGVGLSSRLVRCPDDQDQASESDSKPCCLSGFGPQFTGPQRGSGPLE